MEMVIIEVVVNVLGSLAITALGILGAWLTAKIGQKKELETIQTAQYEAFRLAQETVLELKQTVVDGLKASHEDGKLAKDEIIMLNKLLVEKVIEKMASPTEALLRASGVDLEKLIVGAGEAFISQMKQG